MRTVDTLQRVNRRIRHEVTSALAEVFSYPLLFTGLREGVLASGSLDAAIRLWDVTHGAGRCVGVLHGHSYDVRALAVHPYVGINLRLISQSF